MPNADGSTLGVTVETRLGLAVLEPYTCRQMKAEVAAREASDFSRVPLTFSLEPALSFTVEMVSRRLAENSE